MDDKVELENDPLIKRLGSKFKLTEVHFSVNWYTGLTFHVEYNPIDTGTFSHTHAVDGSGESPDTGCLEVSGDPLVQRSEVKEICFERPEELNVKVNSITCFVENSKKYRLYNQRTQESAWEPPLGKDPLVQRSEVKEICFERPEELNVAVNSQYPDNCDTVNDENDWITCWVKNSKKYGYYNQRTQESTWEPPLGKEEISSLLQLVGPELTANSVDRSEERRLSVGNIELKGNVLWEDYFWDIREYWHQRYMLFSKYDEGIQMDKEGWFSATPECIAEHHAYRCGGGIVVDCFTGVGGNAIRFAPKTTHVIAIDIDPKKIECAQHNAMVYGVKDHIDFITGDSFTLAQKLKADTVFLSLAWGGPKYTKAKIFDINTMLKPHGGQFLFNVAKEIAPRVVMFLPKNVDIRQLAELSLSASPPWRLEVEKNILNYELKAITAYFTNPLVYTD
ncbi:WW domain-containing protein [Artemisia annua]|uniref:Trimethylguanosine synthase n=1 Tax=Artemisia annua TaxID=35608 RepID=A0A2U1MDI0_ARTAN|nr:WW domain-containing protein [Artemisia annua]